MKKKNIIIIAGMVFISTLCGCSDKVQPDTSSSSSYEVVTEAPPEQPTEAEEIIVPPTEDATQAPADVITKKEGVYVYDNAKIFSEEEKEKLTEKLKSLYNERLINAAIVTADHIGGDYPYSYTEKAYDTLYGSRGSGFVLLINNDTNTDSLYKTGSCSTFIPDEVEKTEFYWATRDIVSGKYYDAADRMISLGERCPQHFFDNISLFDTETVNEAEKKLSELKSDVSFLVTSNKTSSSNEDICRYYS